MSAREVVNLLATKQVNPAELLDAVEARCRSVDPRINALPTLCFDRARENAKKLLNGRGIDNTVLKGLPITIKDLNDVSGVRTTYGSAIYKDHVPETSDPMVRHLEAAGGIVYAKSNTPEFGTGGITFNDVFGPTRSPRNTRFASGGSSGGAAASLATGCAWLSHGSDMAGSLRTPAAFCGVTSLRPSPGRINRDSAMLPFDPLPQQGPMARDIGDLALFAEAMFDTPPPDWAGPSPAPVRPARVAYSVDLGITQISDDIQHVVTDLADGLSRLGCNVKEAMPEFDGIHDTFDALRALHYAVSLEAEMRRHPGVMKPEVEWNVQSGLDLDQAVLRDALRNQGAIVNHAARFMADFDLLICPATSVTSVPAEARYPGHEGGIPIPDYYRWLAIAYATTVTTLPVITLPVASGDEGMPIAVQLVGKPGGDAMLIQQALWIREQIDWDSMPIDPVTAEIAS